MNKATAVKIIMFSGIIVGLLFLLIYICSKPVTTILSEPTCSPPCWRNIIPGKSTVEETRTILDNLPLVDTESIMTRGSPWNIYDEIIYFEFRSKRVKGTVRFLDGKVSMLLFDGELGITFGQVIAEYGEPEYITNTPLYGGPPLAGSISYAITAIETKSGLAFSYNTRDLPTTSRTKLTADIEITLFFFFDPASFHKLLENGTFYMSRVKGIDAQKYLIPWTGYGDIEEKYPPVVIDEQ